MTTAQSDVPTDVQKSNSYDVVFDGREQGIVIEVVTPKAPYTRVMTKTKAGDYLQFGSAIGSIADKPFFLNFFILPDGKNVLTSFVGKRVVGYPVIMKKTLPNKSSYLHVDIHPADEKAKVTHQVVANVNVPSENWWKKKCGQDFVKRIDHRFQLPAPATGLVALMRQ